MKRVAREKASQPPGAHNHNACAYTSYVYTRAHKHAIGIAGAHALALVFANHALAKPR